MKRDDHLLAGARDRDRIGDVSRDGRGAVDQKSPRETRQCGSSLRRASGAVIRVDRGNIDVEGGGKLLLLECGQQLESVLDRERRFAGERNACEFKIAHARKLELAALQICEGIRGLLKHRAGKRKKREHCNKQKRGKEVAPHVSPPSGGIWNAGVRQRCDQVPFVMCQRECDFAPRSRWLSVHSVASRTPSAGE